MDIDAFRQLLTPAGQAALQTAAALTPREADFLSHFQSLRRRLPVDLARSALETAILRREAAVRFPFADRLYLTRSAMEQATSYAVAAYRASRYSPFSTIMDLGCSIGGDLLALAALPESTLTFGLDLDPLRLLMAQANLNALGLLGKASLLQADLNSPLPISARVGDCALFFDPARRLAARRFYHVDTYQPPLEVIQSWLPRYPALGVKLSPGVDLSELAGYPAEIEFISLKGELKEGVLWFGPLNTTQRRATLLPGPHSLYGDPDSARTSLPQISDPLDYLLEPDPAVLRAGLVQMLAEQLDAFQLDPDIAYLTCNHPVDTPFARCWAIEAAFPFQLKRLRAYLRQRGVGRLTVKKRGSPLEPEVLIRDLRLTGPAECTIALTHLRGEPIVIILKVISS
jgi:SAM-dependent methyltransferase